MVEYPSGEILLALQDWNTNRDQTKVEKSKKQNQKNAAIVKVEGRGFTGTDTVSRVSNTEFKSNYLRSAFYVQGTKLGTET